MCAWDDGGGGTSRLTTQIRCAEHTRRCAWAGAAGAIWWQKGGAAAATAAAGCGGGHGGRENNNSDSNNNNDSSSSGDDNDDDDNGEDATATEPTIAGTITTATQTKPTRSSKMKQNQAEEEGGGQ